MDEKNEDIGEKDARASLLITTAPPPASTQSQWQRLLFWRRSPTAHQPANDQPPPSPTTQMREGISFSRWISRICTPLILTSLLWAVTVLYTGTHGPEDARPRDARTLQLRVGWAEFHFTTLANSLAMLVWEDLARLARFMREEEQREKTGDVERHAREDDAAAVTDRKDEATASRPSSRSRLNTKVPRPVLRFVAVATRSSTRLFWSRLLVHSLLLVPIGMFKRMVGEERSLYVAEEGTATLPIAMGFDTGRAWSEPASKPPFADRIWGQKGEDQAVLQAETPPADHALLDTLFAMTTANEPMPIECASGNCRWEKYTTLSACATCTSWDEPLPDESVSRTCSRTSDTEELCTFTSGTSGRSVSASVREGSTTLVNMTSTSTAHSESGQDPALLGSYFAVRLREDCAGPKPPVRVRDAAECELSWCATTMNGFEYRRRADGHVVVSYGRQEQWPLRVSEGSDGVWSTEVQNKDGRKEERRYLVLNAPDEAGLPNSTFTVNYADHTRMRAMLDRAFTIALTSDVSPTNASRRIRTIHGGHHWAGDVVHIANRQHPGALAKSIATTVSFGVRFAAWAAEGGAERTASTWGRAFEVGDERKVEISVVVWWWGLWWPVLLVVGAVWVWVDPLVWEGAHEDDGEREGNATTSMPLRVDHEKS